jgi:hypothetical protein
VASLKSFTEALLLVLTLGLAAATLGAQTGISVSGTVQATGGYPIAGASAVLSSESAPRQQYEARTDAQGVYRISVPAAGTYTLDLRALGFSAYRMLGLRLSTNEQKTIAPVLLKISGGCGDGPDPIPTRDLPEGTTTGVLGGRITVAANGIIVKYREPLQVVLLNAEHESVGRVTAKKDGSFRFPDLPEGDYHVQATGHLLYSESWDFFVIEGVEATYRLSMERCRTNDCDPEKRFVGRSITFCQ